MTEFKLGSLIYRCKPYVYVLDNNCRGKRCDYCFKENPELFRCSQCTFVYFCNKNCQKSAWGIHKIECKLLKQAFPHIPDPSVRLMTFILLTIQKYGVDEPFEIVHGHKMNFKRLMSHSEEIKSSLKSYQQMRALLAAVKTYFGEKNMPPKSEFIDIFGKMCINTYSICDNEMQNIGSGIYLGASIFDHSCEPDAEVVFNGIELIIRAVKYISHTDVTKIYVSYIEQLQLFEERANLLKEQYYFSCKCSKCTTSNYENLLTKILIDKNECETLVAQFKKQAAVIKQMKKDKVSASYIYATCLTELEKQDGILGNTHILHIKILEYAFDACIENSQWADALILGKQLIGPYKLLYGKYQPDLGCHLFKVGKIQKLQGLIESAKKNLLEAENVIKITYGTDHPLYSDLAEMIFECNLIS